MLFWTIIKVAFKSLIANKMRSFLTMLGIIIGVMAVICMLSLGTGAREYVVSEIRKTGTNLLLIFPRGRRVSGVMSEMPQPLTLGDAKALLEIPNVAMVGPSVRSRVLAKFYNQNTSVVVLGEADTFFAIRNYEIESGRFFNEHHVDRAGRVAVLGPETARTLFGEIDPIEKTIKINGINFKVLGVTKSKGSEGMGGNPDDLIVIPYTTAMHQMFGQDNLNRIQIMVREIEDIDEVTKKITKTLRQRHTLQEGREDDFRVISLEEFVNQAKNTLRTFTFLLAGVAAVSLLVGGIGIMNIMLVTVSERTREIGLRKAVGARDKDILKQFLIEALVVSLTGGILGIGVALIIVELFNRYVNSPFAAIIDIRTIILSFAFASAVGIFFGWYPAKKAAKLDPIEALRYE